MKKKKPSPRLQRIIARIDKQAFDSYAAAKPGQRKKIARHIAQLGIEMMADAHGIQSAGRIGQTFVDRETGECAAYLEHREPHANTCNDPNCAECFPEPNFLDAAALLSEVAGAAKQYGMPLSEVIENVIVNLHAWRSPPAETYN